MAKVVKMKLDSNKYAPYGIVTDPSENLDATTKNYIQTECKKAGADKEIKFEIVDTLPETGEVQTIYLLKSTITTSGDYYIEYVWDSSRNKLEAIGKSSPDMSLYADKDWFNEQLKTYIQ